MDIKINKLFKIALLILIIATLAFIFVQSMIPPNKSQAESDKVGDIIGEIIPPDTPTGDYIQNNIRKLAHLVEFFVLGCEVALYMILYMPRIRWAALLLPSALLVALLDESIQIFSGRGPSILDVWIDFFGFFISSVIFYTVACVVIFISEKRKQK